MKIPAIAIFLTIVLSIHLLVNWYIYVKTSAFFEGSIFKVFSLKLIFWIVVFSYPAGRILERYIGSVFTTTLIKIGSFWLGAMLYLFLIFLIVDLIRAVNHFLPFTGFLNYKANPGSRIIIIKIVYLFSAIILIAAFINARFPRINQFSIITDKSLGQYKNLRIAAVSDIHLGTIISTKRLNHLVQKINSQNPDIVLFAGDIFDEDIASVINNGLGTYFEQIKAPLGIYAILGNHEYFGGIDTKINYLTSHGVKVLRDSTVLINESFYIAGRDDRSNRGQRKSIGDLLIAIDKSKPVILLDHQPFNLNESAENGIDLQISGHTHHGQLWPFNYITNAIYEVSSGYKKIGKTHVIVSNGYGTWGPPLRLGNRPEILIIDLNWE
jgi:uncharacterized protein